MPISSGRVVAFLPSVRVDGPETPAFCMATGRKGTTLWFSSGPRVGRSEETPQTRADGGFRYAHAHAIFTPCDAGWTRALRLTGPLLSNEAMRSPPAVVAGNTALLGSRNAQTLVSSFWSGRRGCRAGALFLIDQCCDSRAVFGGLVRTDSAPKPKKSRACALAACAAQERLACSCSSPTPPTYHNTGAPLFSPFRLLLFLSSDSSQPVANARPRGCAERVFRRWAGSWGRCGCPSEPGLHITPFVRLSGLGENWISHRSAKSDRGTGVELVLLRRRRWRLARAFWEPWSPLQLMRDEMSQ